MKQLRHSPPRRGGEDAPTSSRLTAQTAWSDRRKVSAKLTTLALRASPPLRGRESLNHQIDHETPEQLREALQRYEELYDFAPISFLTLDKRGMIVRLNETAARLLAFPMEWLRERPFLVFVSQHDITRFLSLLTRLRSVPSHQETIDLDLFINDRLVPVQLSIGSSLRGNQIIYRLAMIDLTETRAIETELKETLHNWYSLVESAPDIIMTVDRKGKIRFVNRYAWGYSRRALVGTQLTDYVSEKDRVKLEKCIAGAFDSGQPSICEVTGVNGDKERWHSFGFGPVQGGSSTRQGPQTTTVTIRDISRHKRTEDSLRASHEQLREFAARLDQVREEERTRVAREIHDELGQALTILKMDLAWVLNKTGSQKGTRKKIKSMIAEVDQTIGRVRKIVSELRPSILDELGLTAAIEWQLSQFQERTGIRGFFECNSENFELSSEVAAALFRVVQEALTNVVRHANARQVRVALKLATGRLRITISDDGKGITRHEMNDRKSFGIVGMRERVHRIAGELNIFSVPGRGTRLEISAPLT